MPLTRADATQQGHQEIVTTTPERIVAYRIHWRAVAAFGPAAAGAAASWKVSGLPAVAGVAKCGARVRGDRVTTERL